MRIFKILGIEPTKNEIEIKEAYLKKLNDTNPEDKPEEFMELRKAYEDAIEYANQDDEEELNELDNNEIGQWMQQVKKVYENFKSRNDLESWSMLLKDDVCQNIETKTDARDALLEFFMENYHLPSNAIRLLNNFFNFEEDVEELYEIFPKQFIDNIIIEGIKYDEYPQYNLFEIKDNVNYDDFLYDFYKMNSIFESDNLEQSYKLLQDLKQYGIYHPEIEIKEAFMLYRMGKIDEAWKLANNINPLDEGKSEIILLRGMILLDKDEIEEAKEYYKAALEIEPGNVTAIQGLCVILMKEGHFIEAREILNEIILDGFKSESIDNLFDEINKKFIEDYEIKIKEGKQEFDKKYLIEIAYTYYMLTKLDEALKIVESIEIDDDTDLMIYRFFARINIQLEKYDEALKYTSMWESSIKNASQEKLNNFLPKYTKLENIYYTRSWIYHEKGEKDNELKELNKALELAPNDIDFLNKKNQILFSERKYEEVLKICDKIIDLNPCFSEAYMAKIISLYNLEFWQECFIECNDWINKEPYNLFAYLYKIRVLIEVEEIEMANEEIKYLKEQGVEDINLEFFEALILDYENNRVEATKIYKKLIQFIEQNDDNRVIFLDELYFYYINEILNTDEEGDVLELAQKGLKFNPTHQGLLYYKGTELTYREEYKDAEETFEYIAELYPDNGYTDRKIGDIYINQSLYEKALEYYNRQIEKAYDIEDYFKRVQVNLDLLNLDDVYKDLIYLDKNLKDDPRVYEYLGSYYNIIDNPKKAYEYFIKAKAIFDSSDKYESSIYLEGTLGIVCSKLGMHEEAIKYYRQNYEITNESDDLLEIYNQYLMMGDFDNGENTLKEYLKLINASKLSSKALSSMANLNLEKKNIKMALKQISLILKPDAEQKREKAKLLFYTENNKKALKLMEEVIKELQFIEDNREDYIITARICLELGEKARAYQYAKKVIELTPIDSLESKIDRLPFIYNYLGNAYAILGEYDKADEYLNKSLTMPRCFLCTYLKCIDGMHNLAYLEYLRGNLEKTKSYLDEIFELDPSRTDAIGLAYKLGFLK